MTGNNEKLRGMWEKEMYAHKKRHTVKFSLFHTHTIGVETLKKVHPLPHTIIPEPHIYVHIYITYLCCTVQALEGDVQDRHSRLYALHLWE